MEKADAFNAFLAFQAQVERQSSLKIKGVYADNSGEYISNQFRAYLQDNGMILYTSQAYSPKMNGIQEHLNRTLVEKTSAMLWTAKLPVSFWSLGLGVATYIKNRSPTIVLSVTPHEAWHGELPNLGHLRIFGCRAQAHVPEELRLKTQWHARTIDCIFIGYYETENLYKLWDIEKNGIIMKHDVIFWEQELGSTLLHQQQFLYV